MNGQGDDRDQRLREYVRRRSAADMPPNLMDDIVQAARATPQTGGTDAPWWRTPLLAAASVVLAVVVTLGGLSLIDPQIGDDPTPSPSPSEQVPSPSASPSASPQATESFEPSPSPTTEPTATPAAGVEAGDVLVAVTDNLVVRSEPGLESEIYEVQLQPGDLLRVSEGPVSADGFEWYQGRVLDPTALPSWPASSLESERTWASPRESAPSAWPAASGSSVRATCSRAAMCLVWS